MSSGQRPVMNYTCEAPAVEECATAVMGAAASLELRGCSADDGNLLEGARVKEPQATTPRTRPDVPRTQCPVFVLSCWKKNTACLAARCTPVALILAVLVLDFMAEVGVKSSFWMLLRGEIKLRRTVTSEEQITVLKVMGDLGSLAAGVVADRWFGSFRVAQFGLFCRLVGTFLLWLCVVIPYGNAAPAWAEAFVCIAIVSLAVGGAAHVGVMMVLGLEQYRKTGGAPMEAAAFVPLFFWLWYASTLLSLAVLYNVGIQVGYSLKLALCTVLAALAFLLFSSCKSRLEVERVAPIHVTSFVRAILQSASPGKVRNDTNTSLMEECSPLVDSFGGTRTKFTINCRPACDEREVTVDAAVADAKGEGRRLLRILPILVTSCLPGGFVLMLGWAFNKQGRRMQPLPFVPGCNSTGSTFLYMDLVAPVTLVLVIPLMYKVVYRLWRTKWICCRWTLLRRVGVGLFFAIASSLLAIIVESRRSAYPDGWSICVSSRTDSVRHVSGMSMAWQLPQYLLLSLAVCLVPMSLVEFTFAQSSNRLRNTYMGLTVTLFGLGELTGGLVMSSLKTGRWADYGLTFNQLHLFFTLFAGVGLLSLIAFTILASRFKHRPPTAR